jgi:EAL domain-containing protein (putative c-di-GMP-specific phosphodiesterase class I)
MTESVMLDDNPQVLATVHAVRAQGVHLSLDDFGTGYSSLGNLHRLPIQELKLDRSFVQDLEHSAVARALTTSVLRIGESLDLQVVAEGVETEEQRVFLAERGCSALQGYLFARPLPPQALEAWLSDRSIRF